MPNTTDRAVPGTDWTLEDIGGCAVRYALVVVLLWVGMLKFTTYEAEGIKPLVTNSPLMSWLYAALGGPALAKLLGVVEIAMGLSIATRPVAPAVSMFGSLGAVVMFLITLSFLVTTPGVWQPEYGFPFLSPMPGQFLAKDVVLLGAALWSAGEAKRAASTRSS